VVLVLLFLVEMVVLVAVLKQEHRDLEYRAKVMMVVADIQDMDLVVEEVLAQLAQAQPQVVAAMEALV
jgi:hypothetical protein